MQAWFKKENLSAQEAFKLVDSDFDGNINHEDLKKFLKNILHVPEQEITQIRLERLYKLLDTHKRGLVQKNDFEKLMKNSRNNNQLSSSMGFTTPVKMRNPSGNQPYLSNKSSSIMDASRLIP